MTAPQKPAVLNKAIDAERAVLGSALITTTAARKAIEILRPADFYRDDHRAIFSAMAACLERDKTVDLVTLAEDMRGKDLLAEVNADGELCSGAAYLNELVQSTSTADHIEHYARLVREASLQRQFTVQLHATAKDRTDENVARLGDILTALTSIRHDRIFDFRTDLADALDEILKSAPTALDTGFPEIDRNLGGLDIGDVTTIGARTNGGKTAMMVKIAMNLAEKGTEILYLTTEMTEAQIVTRVLPMATRIPAWKFRRKAFSDDDVKRIMNATAETLCKLPVKVYGKRTLSIADVRAAVALAKPRVVFVDYLQRCTFPAGDTRAYQIMDFMIALKSLAMDSRTNIIIGCQLDRKLDKAADTRPANSDLKDSGAIEAESDQIILMWKPSEKELRKDAANIQMPEGYIPLKAVVSKNRHGAANDEANFILNRQYVEIVEREVMKATLGATPESELPYKN